MIPLCPFYDEPSFYRRGTVMDRLIYTDHDPAVPHAGTVIASRWCIFQQRGDLRVGWDCPMPSYTAPRSISSRIFFVQLNIISKVALSSLSIVSRGVCQ